MKKKKGIAYSSLALRILTLLSLVLSVTVLVTDNIHTSFVDGSFKDILAYRHVLSIALIAAAYTVLQLAFAIYYACKRKRSFRCLPDFDFYGDKLISLLLATAVGAGFAVSIEFNRSWDGLIGDFYDKGNIATVVLLVATVCMAAVSVLSSINRSDSQAL